MSYRDRYDPYDRRRTSEDFSSRRDSYTRESDRDRDRFVSKYRDRPDEREKDRDRDRSPRDRSQDRPLMGPPTGPKLDSSVNRSRLDQPMSGVLKPSPTAPNPLRDSSTAMQALADVFRKFGDIMIERAQLKQDGIAMDKIVQQREKEFKRSFPRHAEYPSIPEMHKRGSDGEFKQRDEIKKRMEQNKEMYSKLCGSIATALLEALPLVDMKERAFKDAQKQALSVKNPEHEARLTALQIQYNRLEEDLKSTNMKVEDLSQELKTEKENHQTQLNKAFEQNKTNEASALKQENSQLKSELASHKSDVSALLRRVDDLAKIVSDQGGELEKLRTSRDEQAAALGSVSDKLTSHEQILSDFDPENVNKAADFFAIEKDDLVRAVADQQKELDDMKSKVDPLLSLPLQVSGVRTAQDSIILRFGSMVDDLRKSCASYEERITKVEATPSHGPTSGLDNSQANEKLTRDLGSVQNSILGIKAEFDQKVNNLTHMISTLDSQFNNLTTKELFDQIIGQIENLFPNTRQLQQDLEQIVARLREFDQKMANLTEAHKAVNELLSSLSDGQNGHGEDVFRQSGMSAANEESHAKRRKMDKANGYVHMENGHGA